MPIEELGRGMLHLYSKNTSYILNIDNHGQLIHVYWGGRITPESLTTAVRSAPLLAFSPTPFGGDSQYSLDVLPLECPTFGRSDFRAPMFHLQYADGSSVSEFVFDSYQIRPGKPKLDGLPSLYSESDDEVSTLEIRLLDHAQDVAMTVRYTVYRDFDVMTRSVQWINESSRPISILRALSMTVDLPDADYQMLHLAGAWARETNPVWTPLASQKMVSIESRRGATGHQAQPFLALARPGATRHRGDVYGVNLVYSGSFLAFAEVDQYDRTRVGMGINPFDFSWLLEPNHSFDAPEAVMVFSDQGVNGMSSIFHQIYQQRLMPRSFRDRNRPIVVNTWEASYFDVSHDTVVAMADSAASLGVEILVLDDGWFGRRSNDQSSLGDWYVDRSKFPDGLAATAQKVHDRGLGFGLWIEPEMISPDSDLYRAHPDWCIGVDGRGASLARHQRVLDMSRADVQTFVVETVSRLIRDFSLDYIKWDMNRNMTEIGSRALPAPRQREVAHRYMLGVYHVLTTLREWFPDVWIEGCSGGGGRLDPGMLAFVPLMWTSDNTDAAARLQIQQGTVLIYPLSAVSAHVSDVPNHQTGRSIPMEFRGRAAMSAVLGYELDPRRLSEDQRETLKSQISWYKEIRGLVQFGRHVVLDTPNPEFAYAWLFVDEEGQRAMIFYFQLTAGANRPRRRLRVEGLGAGMSYEWRQVGEREWQPTNADELRNVGVLIPDLKNDYQSVVWELRQRA